MMGIDNAVKTNFNDLVALLKARLNSAGKQKSIDENNNVVYIDVDIFSQDMLEKFLTLSLMDFNQTPYFTEFSFDDNKFLTQFGEVLVEGATIQALGAQALLERGREFKINNDGVSFDPPSMSELLNTQYCTLLQHHFEKLKHIKSFFTAYEVW